MSSLKESLLEENTVEITGIEVVDCKCPLCGDTLELRKDGWYCDNAEGHRPFFEKMLKEYEDKHEKTS